MTAPILRIRRTESCVCFVCASSQAQILEAKAIQDNMRKESERKASVSVSVIVSSQFHGPFDLLTKSFATLCYVQIVTGSSQYV